MSIDPIDLTARLVRCPSVTPEEGGALVLLDTLLAGAGFTTTRVDRGGTPNLFAQWGGGKNGKRLGFNGHTDVVPIGNPTDWSVEPFGGEVIDGYLYGRGATDMKSGVAAFVAAAIDLVQTAPPDGAILIAITGDEEGDADHGTRALLDWMEQTGTVMDACIVGEPTSTARTGDVIKIGRRGSYTMLITATGVQGHAAYPAKANNPIHALTRLLTALTAEPLDAGSAFFDPSSLQITTVDVGNPATNVIPAQARATVNIRFNDLHTGDSLTEMFRREADALTAETGITFDLAPRLTGDSFVTEPGPLTDLVSDAIAAETGHVPEFSTTGGTSDARFIKNHCPVVEVGLVGERMHAVDERVKLEHITALKQLYARILADFFA